MRIETDENTKGGGKLPSVPNLPHAKLHENNNGLGGHLPLHHKFKNDTNYYQLLKSAEWFDPALMPKTVTCSPRNRFGIVKKIAGYRLMVNRTENGNNSMECESDLEEDVDTIEARNEDVDVVME